MYKIFICGVLVLFISSNTYGIDKHKVFVLTDINLVGGDPDDRQSWIHLLWYADELEITGVVPDYWNGKGYEACLLGLEAYGQDYSNYSWGEKGYPTPEQVKDKVIKSKEEAIEQLHLLSKQVDQPLYVLVWGGMVTLKDALLKYPDIAKNIRVLTIGTGLKYGPKDEVPGDDCNVSNWNGKGRNEIYNDSRFDQMWWLESNWTYNGMFVGDGPKTMFEKLSRFGAMGQQIKEVTKGHDWAQYFRVGDTPSVTYLLDPYHHPDDPTLSSWAGKFKKPFPEARPNYYTDDNGSINWDYQDPCNTWVNLKEMYAYNKSTLVAQREGMYQSLLEKLEELYGVGSQKLTWHDPMEQNAVAGIGWSTESSHQYQRLPDKAKERVREPVWSLSRHSSGMSVRFKTNSSNITIRYQVEGSLSMPHMPATGVSGVDLYARNSSGNWRWCRGSRDFSDSIRYEFKQLEGNVGVYYLYLPLYNHVKWLHIGVDEQAEFSFLSIPEEKPVVVYGTSIAHGACATRPGLSWTNMVSRQLDYPLLNLAFSGNGRLESELIDLLTEIDAAVYVLDCLPNLVNPETYPKEELKERVKSSVRKLKARRPMVPVLLVDHAGYVDGEIQTERARAYTRVNQIQWEAYQQLLMEGIEGLFYLPIDAIKLQIDDTVDGTHPNDIGMQRYADGYVPVLQEILNNDFVSLFNGRNLDGWVGDKEAYHAENGMIVIDPEKQAGDGNLYTESEFSDFILRFEFQLTKDANNGLGIHAPLTGNVAYEGKELQIIDNKQTKYGKLKPWQYHGSVYGIIPARTGFQKAVGAWNQQEVIVKGTTVKVLLNGNVILDGDLQNAIDNGTIDGKDHPGLLRDRGHIGFLGHGDVVRFRNIRIKDLTK